MMEDQGIGQISRLKRTVAELQEGLRDAKAKQGRLRASVVDLTTERNKWKARAGELEEGLFVSQERVKTMVKEAAPVG